MKQCRLCHELKTISEFYPKRAKCKECYASMVLKYRRDNMEKYREQAARYRRERLAEDGVYAFKDRARKKLWWATKSGKIEKLPCEVCGTKAEAHHHEGYDKPLNVKWLCKTHHMEAHHV